MLTNIFFKKGPLTRSTNLANLYKASQSSKIYPNFTKNKSENIIY